MSEDYFKSATQIKTYGELSDALLSGRQTVCIKKGFDDASGCQVFIGRDYMIFTYLQAGLEMHRLDITPEIFPFLRFFFIEDSPSMADPVHKPTHYQVIEGVEAIQVIASSMTQEQWHGYCLGNIIKYRMRAGKKDPLQQDIDKATEYEMLYKKHLHQCSQEWLDISEQEGVM